MAHHVDNREAILVRLEEIAKTLVKPENVFRNVADVPESNLPAIVILDADEFARDEGAGHGRPSDKAVIMEMEPEVHFVAGDIPEAIGTKLNVQRAAIIKAILTDQTLLGLCFEGDIRYLGIGTGLGAGRSMLGEIGFAFSFAYILRPSRL